MDARILKNKTLYTAQIYNESVMNHTVNFAAKEVYDEFKSQVSDELFKKKDVFDAVEMLKEEINVYTQTNNLVLNKQMKVLLKSIKEIFPDLYSNGENMNEEEKTQEEEKKEDTDESTENTASKDANTDEAEKTEDTNVSDEEKSEDSTDEAESKEDANASTDEEKAD